MHKVLKLSDVRPTLQHPIKKGLTYYPSDFDQSKGGYKIDYDVLLSDGTPLQRNFVWTLEQKQELILSMLKGIRIPSFAAILSDHENMHIIDGKQRLSTILAFMQNAFPIYVNDTQYCFCHLDNKAKAAIAHYSMHFDIINEYRNAPTTDEEKVYWFTLLNYAGTLPEQEHLLKLQSCLTKEI